MNLTHFEEWFKNNYLYINIILLFAIILLLVIVVYAFTIDSDEEIPIVINQPGPPSSLPPQEAINSCEQQEQNSECSFFSPFTNTAVEGTCEIIINNLVCVPAVLQQ